MATYTALNPSSVTGIADALASFVDASTGIVIQPASITYVSGASTIGTFADAGALGLSSGLILTTGTMPGATNTMSWFGQDNAMAGDADLNAVVNTVFQTQSFDATTLEFSFTVDAAAATHAKSVAFQIVFGSDEYPEWVNQFVDIAAVIVNGTNYAYFNNNPAAPLSVIGSNLNAGYFKDNSTSALPIEYDGVSNVLTIVAPLDLTPGAVNHIKIAIGDTGDHIYDSGLLISNIHLTDATGSGVLLDQDGTQANDSVSGSSVADNVQGQAGDDSLNGAAGDDILSGGDGNDDLTGGSGEDFIDGGAGIDTAHYSGAFADYAIVHNADGTWTVSDDRKGPNDGTDTLLNVEKLAFSDGVHDLVPPSNPTPTNPVAPPPGGTGSPPPADPTVPVVNAPTVTGVQAITMTESPSAPLVVAWALAHIDDADVGADIAAKNAGLTVTPDPVSLQQPGVGYNAATQSFTFDPSHAAYLSLPQGVSTTVTVFYTVADVDGHQLQTSLDFVVTGSNEAPTLNGANAAAGNEDSGFVTVSALANVSDVDDPTGASLTVKLPATGLPAGVSFDAATKSFSLDTAHFQDLAKGETLDVVVNYTVSDGLVETPDHITFTVTGRNDAATIDGPADAGPVSEDAPPVTIDLLAQASDIDGDVLHVVGGTGGVSLDVVGSPGVTWNAPIQFSVVGDTLVLDPTQFNDLRAGDTLDITFHYTVTDGTKSDDVPASAHVKVTGADDGITGMLLSASHVSEGAAAGTVVATLSAIDPDGGDTASFALVTEGSPFSIVGNHLTVTGPLDFEKVQSYDLKIQATDAFGASIQQTFTIGIDNVSGVTLNGSSKNDNLAGTSEEDRISGNNGNDTIATGDGNDWVAGNSGGDSIATGAGNDTIAVTGSEAVGDVIDAGTGEDILLVTGNGAVTFNSFNAKTAGIEVWQGNGNALIGTGNADTIDLSGITKVTGLSYVDGGNGNDRITGTDFANDLRGGSNEDVLIGGGGNDRLTGGSGKDLFSFSGHFGDDHITDFIPRGVSSRAFDAIELHGATSVDVAAGANGTGTVLTVHAGADILGTITLDTVGVGTFDQAKDILFFA